jgi:hypothetical protein
MPSKVVPPVALFDIKINIRIYYNEMGRYNDMMTSLPLNRKSHKITVKSVKLLTPQVTYWSA